MAIVTSRKDQKRVADAARRVGGYDQLLRLAGEHRQAKGDGKLLKDAQGRWSFHAASHKA